MVHSPLWCSDILAPGALARSRGELHTQVGLTCYLMCSAAYLCRVVVLSIAQMRKVRRGLGEGQRPAQPICLIMAELESEPRFF